MNPKVFISYSHDSDEHRARVLELSERLRQNGIDTQLDRYVNGTPDNGWPRWMLDQIDWADFVLLVCTEKYYRRFRGHGDAGTGRGSDFEGAIITHAIYEGQSRSAKYVPALFDRGDKRFVPEPVAMHSHYDVTSAGEYQRLVNFFMGRARVTPGALSSVETGPAANSPISAEPSSLVDSGRSERALQGTTVSQPDDPLEGRPSLFGKRSNRRATQVVVGVVATAALAVFGIGYYSRLQHERYVARVLRDFSGCLVGSPLKDRESIFLRLRAIQLVDGHYKTGWPVNCTLRAKEVVDALKDESKDQLVGAVRALTEHLSAYGGPDSNSKIIAAVTELQHSGIALAEGEAPVQPRRLDPYASVETVDRTRALSKVTIPADSISLDSHQDVARHFFVKDATLGLPAFGCRVTSKGCDCFELPGEPSGLGGLSTLGTTAGGATPIVEADRDGARAAFRATTGARVALGDFNSGYSAESGYVALQGQGEYDVGGSGYTIRLVEQSSPDTEAKETTLGPGAIPAEFPHVHRAKVLWDRLFLHVMQKEPPGYEVGDFLEQRIIVFPLPFTGQSTVVGKVNHINAEFSGCRSEKLGVMRFGDQSSVMSIRRSGGSWSAPVFAEYVTGTLYCDDANVFMLNDESNGLGSWRCKESGCDTVVYNRLPGGEFEAASNEKIRASAMIEGRLLFVWRGANAGGIRMRIAHPEAFATASDSVLFDDMVEGGKLAVESTVTSLKIVALGSTAVVILGTTVGTYLFQIDSVGKVTTLAPSWKKASPG